MKNTLLLGIISSLSILSVGCASKAQTVYVYGPLPPPPQIVVETPSVVVVAPSPFFYFGPPPVYPRWHVYGGFRQPHCPPPIHRPEHGRQSAPPPQKSHH